MSWLLGRTTAEWVDEDAISLSSDLPIGFWRPTHNDLKGTFFEKTEYSPAHGKIYGNSEKIANHVVNHFNRVKNGKNFGVLFSGEKGLGKSLSVKLIVEKLYKEHPVIFVEQPLEDLAKLLNSVKDAVIIFDEFEKTFEDDEGEQDELLSILDGKSNENNNLYLFTVNETYRINENMISRPGRIMYHYKFKTLDVDTIRAYFEDVLSDKSRINELIDELANYNLVSMDILSSLALEVNTFPELSTSEIFEYFNIECTASTTAVKYHYLDEHGEEQIYEDVSYNNPGEDYQTWVNGDDFLVKIVIPRKLHNNFKKVYSEVVRDKTKDNWELEKGEVYPQYLYAEVAAYENFSERAQRLGSYID